MIQDLFEILVAYYQYLANIVTTKGVKFTVSWTNTGQGLSFSTLDVNFFNNYIPAIAYDARVFFIIVSIILPLALIFLGLVAFNEPNVVVWYFVLLGSTFTLLAGVAAAIISQTVGLSITLDTSYILMGGGAGGLLLCSILYMIYKLTKDIDAEDIAQLEQEQKEEEKNRDEAIKNKDVALNHSTFSLGREMSLDFKRIKASDSKEDAKPKVVHRVTKKDIFRRQTEHFRCFPFIQGVLFALVAGAAGALLIIGTSVVGFNSSGSLGQFAWVIGVVLVGIAALVLIWTVPSVARRGREIKWHISQALQENGMRLLILLIMILYIPIGSSSIAIFNCNSYSCPTGYRLVDRGTAFIYNTTNYQGLNTGDNPYCAPCHIDPTGQRASSSSIALACANSGDSRLESAPETRCATMQKFFWPAAGLAFVFILGAPLMFFTLIRRGTAMLKEDFPVDPRLDDWEAIWEAKIVESSNVSKFLYQPFEFKYRYWRLAQIAQKLAIVVTGTYVFKTPWQNVTSSTISLSCALFVHVVMSVAYFITEPFIRLYDDGVCTVLHWCLVSCVTIAILILYGYVPPEEFNLAIIIAYLALPVILFLIGVRLEMKWAREAEEKAEDDQRVRVVEHMQKMDAKDMRAAIEERKRKQLEAANAAANPLDGPTEQPQANFAGIDDDNEEPDAPSAAMRPMTATETAANARTLAERAKMGRDAHQVKSLDRPSTKQQTRPGTNAKSFRGSGMVRPGTTTESHAGPGAEGEAPVLALARIGTAKFSMRDALSRAGAGGDERETSFERIQKTTAASQSFRGTTAIMPVRRKQSTTSGPSRKQSTTSGPSEASSGGGVDEEDEFATSGSMKIKADVVHSSDDDDLKIEDKEEAAKQEEKRAALMAQVLRAEQARKNNKDKDMSRSQIIPLEQSGSFRQESDGLASSMGATSGGASPKFGSPNFGTSAMDGSTTAVTVEPVDAELALAAHALEVIEEQMREEREQMLEKQEDVDLAINIWTRRSMNTFLMIGGFIGFAALGVSLLGILSSVTDVYVSTSAPMTTDAQLAGYLTWDFFAQACVCNVLTNSVNASTDILTIEQWICDNNRRMERPRERRTRRNGTTVIANGYPMRNLCGGYFTYPGCAVTLNRDSTISFGCPANITTFYPSVDVDLW